MGEINLNQKLSKNQIVGYLLFTVVLLFVFSKVHVFFSEDHPNAAISDKQAFLIFYRQVINSCKSIDATYKPLADALGKQHWLEAAQIAKLIKDPMNDGWYNLTLIKVPDLKNSDTKKELEKGKEYIDMCYYHKNQIIKKYLELIKNPSGALDSGSDIINSSARIQQTMILGLTTIMSAGKKVGVTIDDMKL